MPNPHLLEEIARIKRTGDRVALKDLLRDVTDEELWTAFRSLLTCAIQDFRDLVYWEMQKRGQLL